MSQSPTPEFHESQPGRGCGQGTPSPSSVTSTSASGSLRWRLLLRGVVGTPQSRDPVELFQRRWQTGYTLLGVVAPHSPGHRPQERPLPLLAARRNRLARKPQRQGRCRQVSANSFPKWRRPVRSRGRPISSLTRDRQQLVQQGWHSHSRPGNQAGFAVPAESC